MCLAIPAKIIEKKGNKAIVDYGGVKREIDISLVNAKKGDYVIVHAGFAIQIIDEKEASETVKIFEEILKNA
ncbi:MAG: HypC/HybG/HupF family hydrogenase formation chaperone [Thermoplasmatales archaeon]|nr:HypC/HybG/HupF family hydrogenase formation chaperone [Thermoplasmatales archaeon]